ncbi:multidrug ABC transporter ATP-binding protein [Endozoicomonas sp. OPT23]|uniref:ABC transporter ATP-binding protein n=1 Tax=Endozoicomonas sp. OPT23 TaxID=2072845 RepID=UPI00129BB26D|nr:ABC transporter transmembrane domain-containing protein [Endozoicomonas sp. OPT23]MRI32760.1 multidrug ABC transporter ATP-binding protein [Endozoicomonas sp. OPT23]
MKLLWKMRHILRDYWKQYLFAFISLQTVAILNLLAPWLIGRFVDEASNGSLTHSQLLGYVGMILASAVVIYGLRYLWRSLLYGAAINLVKSQRDRLFSHFTKMSPDFYQKHSTGDLMAHATNDLNAVEESAGSGIMTLVDSLIAGFTVLAAMIFAVSGKLALLALLPFPLLIWSTNKYGNMLHKRFSVSQATFSSLNEEAREAVSGIRAVKAHQLDQRQQNRFSELSNSTVDANRRVALVDSMFGPSIQLFFGMSMVITLLAGSWMIKEGEMTLGLLTSFTLYLGQLLGPMLQFGWQFNVFQRGSASWSRLEKLFNVKPAVKEATDAVEAPEDKSLIINLDSFSYPRSENQVLDQIQLNIPQGQLFGITGRTGSGKSTLFRLLQREFNLTGNSAVAIGGTALEQIKLDSLRAQFGWVPQDPMLFSGTIAENIAFAKPEATQEEIENAAQMAAIHDEIVEFNDGYQTILGEQGINLSGGQKQRVAFARALLKDTSILLLDDSFSALDMKTEATILKNLQTLRGNKTIILITQRLPELVTADQIVVLEEGSIVEQGNHDQLVASGEWYSKIFNQQARTLLLEAEKATQQTEQDISQYGALSA